MANGLEVEPFKAGEGFRAWGLGSRVSGLGFRVWGLGFGDWAAGELYYGGGGGFFSFPGVRGRVES